MGCRRRIAYFYDSNEFSHFPLNVILTSHAHAADVGHYSYGYNQYMKPYRIRMAHNLIGGYGMLDKMRVLVSSLFLKIACKPDVIYFRDLADPRRGK